MSDFTILIEDIEPNTIIVETSFVDSLEVLEIERAISSVNIISQSNILGINDLPDIPFSKVTGNLPVSRISGLGSYLDSYFFDCGTP